MTWKTRLKNAQTNGFSIDDKIKAGLWSTCAVSELPVHFKDGDITKGPEDINLILDGISFMTAVEKNDIKTANSIFESLTKRGQKLSKN